MSAPAPTGGPKPLGFLIFVGAVVLAVVASVITTTTIERSREVSPAQVVQGFLQAVADADATKALSYAAATPVDQTLLTDAVLASSQKAAPISAIVTTEIVGLDGEVDAHYQEGDQASTDRYTLTKIGGQWKIDHITNRVSFVPVLQDRIPVLVNGVEVDANATDTFPGRYTVTTGLRNVDWGASSTGTVTLQASTVGPLDPRMTKTGKAAFVTAARKRVAACTSQHKLEPTDCPFGFLQPSKGPSVPDSTVRWTVKGNPWPALADPQIEGFLHPGEARAETAMTFVLSCRYSTGDACEPDSVTKDLILAGDVTVEPLTVDFASF